MQGVKRSSNLIGLEECGTLEKTIDSIVREAQKHSRVLLGFLEESDDLFIAYSGRWFSEPSAHLLYLFLSTLVEDFPVRVGSIEEFLYYVAGYTDKYSSVVFLGEPGSESLVFRLLSVLRATGRRAAIVSPPLPPQLIGMLETSNAVYSEIEHFCPLLGLITSFYAGVDYASAKKTKNMRISRLLGEKDITSALDELNSIYSRLVGKIRSFLSGSEGVNIVYSTTMRAPALLLQVLGGEKTCPRLFMLTEFMQKIREGFCDRNPVIVFTTTVESDVVRELKSSILLRCGNKMGDIVDFTVKTDPLTAPIYASIVLLGGLVGR